MVSQPIDNKSGDEGQEPFQGRTLHAEGVHLAVIGGAAYLDGYVASYGQKKAIAAATAALPGVSQVVNRLRVTPCGTCSDHEVAQGIYSALGRDNILSLHALGAVVTDGVAELSGQASSLSGRIAAEAIAWSVPGVRHVVNHIQVAGESAPDAKGLSSAIKRALQYALGLSPTAFDIRIEKDTAILSGSVSRPDQRLEAEDLIRYHPTIRRVVNNLRVSKTNAATALSDLPPPA